MENTHKMVKTGASGLSTEARVEEFFKRRFPEKDIAFEKKCGYFGEWVERFESGTPERCMDDISQKVWADMQEGK